MTSFLTLTLFIDPGFASFESKTFGLILAIAQMRWIEHLKLPAAVDPPTDVDGQIPTSRSRVQVGNSNDEMVSVEQIGHFQNLSRSGFRSWLSGI
jgi:hypothetical protein